MGQQIFSGQAVNGNSVEFTHGRAGDQGRNALLHGTIHVRGTVGGAVMRIQQKAPDDSFGDAEEGLITAAGSYPISAPYFVGRLTLENAGGTTDLDVWYEG